MKTKILLSLGAVLAVVAGVAAMSAYEAHVINVTATIENALAVDLGDREGLDFGVVFPQEKLYDGFEIYLSDSFDDQDRVDVVDYKIVQKPKEIDGAILPILCPWLSKLPQDGEDNDWGIGAPHPWPAQCMDGRDNDEDGKFDMADPDCAQPGDDDEATPGDQPQAGGQLVIDYDDDDPWTIDLVVPCFRGMMDFEGEEIFVNKCAQDYPHDWPTLDPDDEGETFGCDLWIEVTGISEAD